jgi:hypothetical protein
MSRIPLVHFSLTLTILIPLVLGVFRYKDLDSSLKYFLFYLSTGFLSEILIYFFDDKTYILIVQQLYLLLEGQLILIMFLKWSEDRNRNIFVSSMLFLVFSVFDSYLVFNSENNSNKSINIIQFIILIIVGIRCLLKNNNLIYRLVVIPFTIYATYYIVLNILIAFLYDESKKILFIDLFGLITFINFLSYISYSLAFLWAPKKEKYL